MAKSKTTTVYVVHHTNQGTPESGEIHSIHPTEKGALKEMEFALQDMYEVTMQDNQDEDFIYMYISEQFMYH